MGREAAAGWLAALIQILTAQYAELKKARSRLDFTCGGVDPERT
jgi:hypothetical protein